MPWGTRHTFRALNYAVHSMIRSTTHRDCRSTSWRYTRTCCIWSCQNQPSGCCPQGNRSWSKPCRSTGTPCTRPSCTPRWQRRRSERNHSSTRRNRSRSRLRIYRDCRPSHREKGYQALFPHRRVWYRRMENVNSDGRYFSGAIARHSKAHFILVIL